MRKVGSHDIANAMAIRKSLLIFVEKLNRHGDFIARCCWKTSSFKLAAYLLFSIQLVPEQQHRMKYL
jgi:hypothetical protein